MPGLSAAAGMAWRIAAAEAATARHLFIEREHLLIGLCSLHKTLGFVRFLKAETMPAEAIREEADAVEDMLAALGISSVSLRRGVRSRLRPGHARHADQAIHRSDACKEIFKRARETSERAGAAETTAPLLLATFLAYLPSMDGEFQYDDQEIAKTTWVREASRFLGPSHWRVVARPLTGATFAINHAMSGFRPRVWHATNVLVHLAAVVLVWRLARRLLARAGLAPTGAVREPEPEARPESGRGKGKRRKAVPPAQLPVPELPVPGRWLLHVIDHSLPAWNETPHAPPTGGTVVGRPIDPEPLPDPVTTACSYANPARSRPSASHSDSP